MIMLPSKGRKEPRLPSNAVKELLQMAGCGCKGNLVGFNSSVANFDVVGDLNLKVSIYFSFWDVYRYDVSKCVL